jgi:glutaminyl-peptide cyclotransferase
LTISNRILRKLVTRAAVALSVISGVALPARAASVPTVRPEIVATFPHDRDAFTQGLVFHEGRLFESTGLIGRSTLRRVVPSTGAVEKSVTLAGNLFGEGLALVGDRFIQLTWQNHVALRYDLDFTVQDRLEYTGEGWGLCYDGQRLVMSDGSSRLLFRNPTTFAVTGDIEVRSANGPVTRLNELECVGPHVYANVWQTNRIVRIDPGSGDVTGIVDASGLLTGAEAARVDVLNGIAFDPGTGHFFITGKLWPRLFEVRFGFDTATDAGPADGSSGSDASAEPEGPAPEPPAAKEPRARSDCGCRTPLGPDARGPLALFCALAGLSLVRKHLKTRG